MSDVDEKMDKDDFRIIHLFLALKGIRKITSDAHNRFKDVMEHEGYDDSDVKEAGRSTMGILSVCDTDGDREEEIRHQLEKYSNGSAIKKGNTVHNRNMLWTLINLSFAYGTYSKAKQRLVHLYASKIGLDKSYVLEMEAFERTRESIIEEQKELEKNPSSNEVQEELDKNQRILEKQISDLVLLG